ncbi:hypothetical protein [Candidatus Lokiarchaeum ossiferum]|uniref:hypothetical protein n=1 Tax=Candidatus Lokiarchaeum ossiferum TaxID=2951803 RepID=UPI00352D91B4
MKTKKIITYAFVLCVISMLMGPGAALPAATQSTIINNTESVSIDSEFPTNTKIAMLPEKNYPFNVHVEGDNSGIFDYIDFEGTIDRTFTTTNQMGYPTSLGTLNPWVGDAVENPWDIEWLDISCPDLVDGESVNYNITLSTSPLGSLSVGAKTEFDTRIMSDYRELELIVGTPGFYILYYEADTTLSSPHLIDKNQTEVGFTAENLLPLISDGMGGGTTIRKFAYFWADYTGSFTLFFKTTTRYVTFELVGITDITALDIGDRVIYQDSSSEEIDPSTLMAESAYFPIQLYSFPVSTGQYLRFNYAEIWGTPMSFLLLPSINGYQMGTIATDGTDSFIPINGEGTAYFAVLHNQYFNMLWNSPLYYKFAVYDDGIPVYELPFENNTVYTVDPLQQKAILEFDVNETTSIHMNYTIHQGGSTYTPANDFYLVDSEKGYTTIGPLMGSLSSGYYYDLVPGHYRLILHSTSLLQKDVIEFQTKIIPRTELTSVSHPKTNDVRNKFQTIGFESTPFDEEIYYPHTFNFSYNDNVKFGYNVSIYPEENSQFFNQELDYSEVQMWFYNGSEYLNQTMNPNPVDLFYNGSTAGNEAYFGFDRPITKMSFNLLNVSSSMNYTWEYCDGYNSYAPLDYVVDGTNATGSTLGQSGTIHFDYDPGDLSPQSNPDGSGGVLSVGKSIYWFRLRCSEPSPSSIPAINGYSVANPAVKYTKYSEITVEYTAELDFVSKYDNLTRVQYGTQVSDAIGTNPYLSGPNSNNHPVGNGLFGTGDALLLFWPTVYEYDWVEDDVFPSSIPVNLRVGIYDENSRYKTTVYSSAIGTDVIDLTDLNFTTYNSYGLSRSYNETLYDGEIISVEGNLYDWYQFIFETGNTDTPISAALLFDNVWINNVGVVKNNYIALSSLFSSELNDSIELGIGPSQFKIMFTANADNSSESVDYQLNIISFGVQLLTPNMTIVSETAGTTGVPKWVLPVSIGGGVAIIAIIGGVVVYKKKNPI